MIQLFDIELTNFLLKSSDSRSTLRMMSIWKFFSKILEQRSHYWYNARSPFGNDSVNVI